MSHRIRAVVHTTQASTSLALERPLEGALAPGEALHAHYHGPEGLLLLRERPGVTGALAGSLSTFSLAELLGLLVGSLRTGRLHLQSGGVRKAVAFRDGQVVFAASSEPHERLGAVLVRLGLVPPEALREALAEGTSSERVGQVLVRKGQLSSSALYSAMTFLAREVLIDLFALEDGDFLFLEGSTPVEDALRLPERTRDLVLLGIKRGEALARLRRKLPRDTRLLAGARRPEAEEAGLVAALTAGTLGEARAQYDGSEHAFLTEVSGLLEAGVVALPPPLPLAGRPRAAPGALTPMYGILPAPASAADRYGALIRAICGALREAGQGLESLRDFLATPSEGLEDAFRGVTLSEAGELDVGRVLENLEGGGPALSRARALEALDLFAAFALFSAKNALPPERAAALDARFRALQAEGT